MTIYNWKLTWLNFITSLYIRVKFCKKNICFICKNSFVKKKHPYLVIMCIRGDDLVLSCQLIVNSCEQLFNLFFNLQLFLLLCAGLLCHFELFYIGGPGKLASVMVHGPRTSESVTGAWTVFVPTLTRACSTVNRVLNLICLAVNFFLTVEK